MTVTGALARPMLAGIFIYGGVDAIRHPEGKAAKSEDVGPAIAQRVGLPTDPITLVRINGAVQLGAGTLLAFGKCRRLASVALAASLAPTTYAGHRFWEETDPAQRHAQQVHFLKNVAVLGGLILAAGDTGGRPTVTWTAKRATKRAVKAARPAAGSAAKLSREATRDAAAGATIATMQMAQLSRKAARAAQKAAGAAGSGIADTAGKTREILSDLPVDQVKESAVQMARELADRTRDLPVDQVKESARALARELADRTRDLPIDQVKESARALARELADRTRDLPVDQMRDTAVQKARVLVERGREVFPVAS